jgi:O-antigen/teichoic acid export membrane protein
VFGRFALLMAVSTWFAILSNIGAVPMLTRCVPRFVAARDRIGLTALTTSLTALRGLTGACSAAAYFALAALVLREPDAPAVAFVAAGLFCRTTGNVSYALFLGLNRAARWGAGDLLRRWLGLILVTAGFLGGGLRGACQGFFLAELAVQLCGLWWARDYLDWSTVDLSRRHLGSYLKVSTMYAAAGLLETLTQRSGEAIVRLSTGSYEQVAFFGAAYAIYLTAASALWQATMAFAPLLVTLLEQGHRAAVADWLARLLKVVTVAAVLAVPTMVFLGPDLVPWLLGSRYAPVAANAVPVMLLLLPSALGNAGRLLALALDRPKVMATAAAIEMVTFWCVGTLLAPKAGSLGACWAALPAAVLQAGYLWRRTRRELPFSLTPAAQAVALSVVFVPLAWLRGSLAVNGALLAAGTVAYAALLVASGTITIEEIAGLRRELRAARGAAAPAIAGPLEAARVSTGDPAAAGLPVDTTPRP